MMAVKLPAFDGNVVNVMVSDVAVAEAIVPTAPLFRTTELFAATASKPKPSTVIVEAFATTFVVLTVTTGVTVAT